MNRRGFFWRVGGVAAAAVVGPKIANAEKAVSTHQEDLSPPVVVSSNTIMVGRTPSPSTCCCAYIRHADSNETWSDE